MSHSFSPPRVAILLLGLFVGENVQPGQLPGRVSVSLKDPGPRSLGQSAAPVTIVEFSDLECRFCRRFHATTFERLRREYIASGSVRYILADFPLQMHPNAKNGAAAARCAGRQAKYWQMRGALQRDNVFDFRPAILEGVAAGLSLDLSAFALCMSDLRTASDIAADVAAGEKLGVVGTPTFVVGRTTDDGADGILIPGAQSYDVFKAQIDHLLATR